MTAAPATRLTPRSPAGISIGQAVSEADLAEAAAVQHHAYQLPRPPGPHDIARLTRLARTAHSQGISLVFLEAEPAEEQIYRRTGFTDAATKIWASIR
jgi:hypothetical protein